MNYFISILTLSLSLLACQSSSTKGTEDLSGYTLTETGVPGYQKAVKEDNKGNVLESGYVHNGVKTGMWNTYRGNIIASVKNYIEGQLFGPTLKINDRNQITKMSTYENNKLNGRSAEYKFSRPMNEINFKDGKMDGKARYYFVNSGKLQKVINYNMGAIDGEFLQYNEDGEMILKYTFKNGQKISGGVIDSKSETPKKD